MARPGDWSPLGLHGDPTPGDLDILQSLHTEFQGLGDLASEVNSGLDRVLNQSTDSFIGKTAEAVRKKIDGHLKKFIASVGHSFSVSGPATLDYLNAIQDAQAKADQALASAQGLSHDDPQLVSLKAQVHDAQDQYNAAASSYADKLWHAGKIEQPISGWQLFLQALGILAIILAVLGAIFGGWVGLIALAVNVALLIKTAVEFAEGKASLLDLVLAVIGVLFPSTKGLNIGQLSKGLFNALKNLPKMAASGLSNVGKGLTHFFTEGITFKSIYNGVLNLPGLALRGLTAIGGLVVKGVKVTIGGLKLIGSTFKNDFHLATIGTTTTLGKIGVYAMSFGSRFLVSATLPLDFFELGVGARAAIKVGLGTRLTTPWAHLSQPIVGGGLHVGALAGGHFSFHAANGTTGFGGLDHGALGGLNGSALPGLHSTGTAGLGGLHGLNTGMDVGGLHGLNTGVDVGGLHGLNTGMNVSGLHGLNTGLNVGGLHNLSTAGTVHLGAGVTPDALGHALAGVGGDASAVDHLTAFDHATGFDRTASGLLEPMGSHFSAGHVGTTHLGSMNLATGSATSHLGVSGVHNLRTDLTGSATGLHTAISDSMSGVRGAAGHAADFHAIGISELKSIADGDISGLRMTPDGVSMHIGAQSGTPTALHMNFRTMSLTDGAGHQVVVAPEAHTALGTTDIAAPTPVHTGAATPTPVHGTGATTPAPASVHTAPPASATTSVKDTASTPLTDVKAPATTHGAPSPSSSAAVKTEGPARNLDELSGGATSLNQQGRFAEGPAEHAVTAQNGHVGVSAHDQLDLSGRREGTGDTAGAATPTPTAHETEAVAGALSATPIAVRPGPARTGGTDIASGGGADATAGEHIAVRPAPRPHTGAGGVTRPPKSRFEAITGGVGGRIGAERMAAWNHYEKGVGDAARAEDALHDLGGGLDKPSETIDQAAAKLDAQQAGLGVDAARQDLARLGMDVDSIQARLDQLVAPTTHPGTPLGGDLATAGTHDAAAGAHDVSVVTHDAAAGTHDVSVATHDAASADGHGAGADAGLSKLEELRAPTHTPEKSPIESAPKAPTDAPSSGLSKTAGWYVDRLDGIARDAGMSPADRSLYKQAIDDAVRADDFRGVARNYAQFRDHVELTTLNHRYDAFTNHIDQGFDRLGDLGVDRAAWQAKVDAVHDARAAHDLDLQNAALRDYTAFVERHVPSEVLTGKDVPKAFDANLRRVLGDLATAGGPGEYVRLRQELGDLLEMNGFQERLDALRGELGDEEAALHARIGSSATPEEGASALQALHDFRADQDLAARLDALKSDTSGASHAVDDGSLPGLQERLDALRGAATDPHEIELQRLFDEAVGEDDQARALQDLHDYREERDFQARLDALRHDDGADHLDTSAGAEHVSDEELADRFAALGHGDDPRIVQLRQEALAAGSAEESAAILDKLHAHQDHQEVLRQERVAELRSQIDALTTERNEHLLGDRFDQADRLGGRLDDLQRALDGSLSEGEKHAELFTELAKGIDSPEAAGHLDRIVDNGLSKAAEHAAGAGGDAERSFEDIEKLLGSLRLPDSTPHTLPGPAETHLADTGADVPAAGAGHGHVGELPDGDGHFGDLHTEGAHDADLHATELHATDIHATDIHAGGHTGDDAPPPRVSEPGTQELTLEAPKERPESGATTGPDLTAHPVPTALTADDLRILRGEHEPEVAPARVDTHPQWDEARGGAAPKTVERSWVDPVSTPAGQGAHAPRYQVTAAFDVRQFTLDEQRVTDLTVRVDLAGAEGVAAHELDAVWERAQLGIDRVFNAPGHQLPDGGLLHVTLERADGAAGKAHLTVEVGGPTSAADQHHWPVDATGQDLAHEIGHQLGLRDEYPGAGAEHRPDVHGSLMGNYHNPPLDGLAHGGMRDRYLHVLQDHIASLDGAAATHGAAPHAGDTTGIAPHAPRAATAKTNVKGGRGGASTSGAARSENLAFDTEITRFGGSKDFQRALGNYEITPLVQYKGLDKGAAEAGDGVRFVATVPATADTDLLKLAQKYGEGFAEGSSQGDRFGLVIGINGRPGKETEIKQAVEDFAKEWDKSGTFPVAVTGFTWRQPDPHLVAQGTQKEIPYGAIRETVARDDLTSQMIKKLWPGEGSSGDMYLHIGDADVHSLTAGDKPLFDKAGDLLSQMKAEGKDLPEVLSGGYRLPGAADVKTTGKNGKALKPAEVAEAVKTAKAVEAAADLDLAVRAAMAKVDARMVYFPEPNTFVKVNSDSGLENGISFGEVAKNDFRYEAKEGQYLVDSVVKTRHAEWDLLGPDLARKIVSFDPDLALVTDAGRIGANVKDDIPSLLHGLTQSHASRKTWTDQMDHYLAQHHPDLAKPHISKGLADIAFHDIRTDGRPQVKSTPQTAIDALGGQEKYNAFRSGNGAAGDATIKKTLVPLALITRKALVDGLPGPSVAKAVSPPAPLAHVADALHAGHGGGTAHNVRTAVHDGDVQMLPPRVDAHPQWNEVRGTAVPDSVTRDWVDPVSHPMGTGAHAPRYQVSSAFDVRRFELDGRGVTDVTVRVDLAGTGGVAAHEVEALWDRALSGVDRVFNAPGHELPDGDVLHVTLERADSAATAHVTVEVGGPASAADQHHWPVDATGQDLAHEIGHQLGLRDEYPGAGAAHRPDVQGSLMGDYHRPAPEGLAQGGVRDRYLQLIHDHIGSADGSAHLTGAGTHGLDGTGLAPHAPTAKASTSKANVKATSKVTVKGGRGGSSTAEATLSKQLSFETAPARFTGSQNFQQAVRHYDITPFVQYDGLAKGVAENSGDGVRFVATVPATADVDLMQLAQKYAEGFGKDGASGLGERFGLVIGINGRVGNEAAIKEAVQDFAKKWDESGTFPVAVTGFTWRQPDPALVKQGTQKEIPYGAIRESIVRDQLTSRMIDRLWPGGGSGELYLHVGDADVKSMVVGGKPLFDRVTAKLDELAEKGATPEVLSGGYTLPGATDGADGAKAAKAAKTAADLDLSVRQAIAKVDARFVYFPEPNTFVKVGNAGGLEKDISFGTLKDGRFTFEAKEGERLVDSVIKQRGFAWSATPTKAAVFDSGLALVTDDTRIGAKVTEDADGATSGLTQSHAARGTWADQMKHYLELFHPDLLKKDAGIVESLAAIAFHGTKAGELDLAKTSPKILGDALGGAEKWQHLKATLTGHPEVGNIAVATREALIADLKKQATSVSPPAPTATRSFVSPPAPQPAGSLEARSVQAVHGMTGRPEEFLGEHTVLLRMDEGMKARTPGLGINHKSFLKWLDDQERHWFTLTPSPAAAEGKKVYLLTPAVEKYVQEYGDDAVLRGIVGDRELPQVGADSDYIAAHYVPYKTGGTANPLTDIGHRVIPIGRGGEFNPDFVFTGTMNGCALTVTSGHDAETFTAWHYQSPSSNRADSEAFRMEHRPTDWFGDAEYQSLGLQAMPEITNVMWRGDDGWQFLSQEVHASFNNLDDTTLARFQHRPIDFTDGHQWSYTAHIYLRGAEERLEKLTRIAGDKLGLLGKGPENLNLVSAFELLKFQAERDVKVLNGVHGPQDLATHGKALADEHEQTAALVNSFLDKQAAVESAEDKARWAWQKPDGELQYRRDQMRQYIRDLGSPHWGEGLRRESVPAVPETGSVHSADITDALAPPAPPRPHGPDTRGPAQHAAGSPPFDATTLKSAPAHGGTATGAVRLDHHPQWDAARGTAAPATLERSWVDPVSRPMGSGPHAPRYEVRSAFDVRRFEVDGRGVTDMTVRVELAGADGLSAHDLDALWERARLGVDRVFNAPGHELPDGDLLHVTLERAGGAGDGAHLTVEVGGPRTAMNQHQWAVDASGQDLAHEIGHQLGLRDEYQAAGSEHRPDINGSLMGNYHEAAENGLTQGGVRDRYLRVLHDHVVSLEGAVPAGHGAGPADPGVAPHAPTTTTAGPSAKAAGKSAVRGPRPAEATPPGVLSFDKATTRFGGSHDFQQAVAHYEITPLVQYDSLAKGAAAGDGVRFVATVPATADVDLMELVKKYEAGFGADGHAALNERFGLVIGINGRPGREAALTKAVRDFAEKWDATGTFPVAVTGFTWRQPDPGLVAQGTQKEIPYGAIRESVLRDELTSRMIEKFRPGPDSSGEIYLHVGDADVKSMTVGGKPLFDRVTTRLAEFERAPEVLSGGYTLPGAVHGAGPGAAHAADVKPGRAAKAGKGAKAGTSAKAAQDAVKAEAARAAAELDLKVRAAMAEVDARAVYFPEPNTFVRVDPANGVEREIGFGAITGTGRFSYEALEGRHLVDSVVTTRGFGWHDAADMAVFDPSLALVTDDERIAAEVTGEGKTVLNGLTQSHAARGTWSDQMAHYIGRYHPEVLQQTPDVLHKLAAIAFHDIEADGRTLAKTSPKTLADALGGASAWKEFVKDRPVHQKLAKIAIKTRDALVDGLKKPETAAAVSPAAPVAAHGATPATRPAGHGTAVSPRAPLPHTAHVTTTDRSALAETRRAGGADLTITEVDRAAAERGPVKPTLDSPAPPPPFRMTHTQQLSAADRILPSRTTANTLADRLVEGLDGVLTQGQRDALRADWTQELATDVWPALSAMTRGEVRTLRMDVAGWTGDVEVTAKVVGADSDGALDSLEFEDGSETFTRGGFQREKLTGLTAGVLVKGKAAEKTDLTGQLSVNWTSSQSQRVATSGRMFTRTKTAEPALKVGADIAVQFDFSAVRGRFGAHFDLARAGGERVTTLDVPLRVPVATGAAESGVPDLSGAQHYLPPLRVEQTLALGGSDTLRDAFLVDGEGERTAGRLDTALLGDPADATSLAAFGRRTFGSDWDRVSKLVLDRLGSLDVLQFELKGMTAGEAVEIDLGEGMGHLLVTAEVASMKQRRNTAKTEFNTGSDITRVFSHGSSSDLATRATMNAQSADLHAGPGSLTGTVHGQFDREGVTIRQESVRTGTAVKMKVPGVVFDGVATLSFTYRADPLGAAPRTATPPDTTAAAHRTAAAETTPAPADATTATTPAVTASTAVRTAQEGRARIGFQVLVDAAEARPVAGAGAFAVAERPAGPRRMTATEVEAGDIAWRPSPKVWDGLPPHTVVYDVLTGEQAAADHAAVPALGDLVDGLGRTYFGSDWAELRPAAQDMTSRAQLAATLPPLTRDTSARSAPLPTPLRSDAQLALTGRLESLEYLRTLDAAEVNLLSDVTDDVANRLNSAVTHGEWIQGGVQPDVTDNVTIGVHAPGAAYAKRFRSGAGISGGTNSVASAKYAEPMVAYIARASVEATLGRPGDAAAQTGRTEVRFVVAIPKSHTVSYEVAQDAPGYQVFTRPATTAAPVHPPATAPETVTAPAHPATVAVTTAEPLKFQPPERVTGGKRIGTGDVVVQLDDEAAVVAALKKEISGAFGDRWVQVEGDLTLFFDKAVMQPKTAGLTAGEHWGSSFTAGPVTADIRITAAEAEMTEYLRVEKNFEFEQGTESSAAATTSKDTTSRRTLWQRFVVKAPHTAATLAHMRHSDALTGRTFDARSGVVAKNKTVEPAALFKGRLTYTVEVKISHLVPGLGSERTLTVGTGGEFAFPTRDLPIDPVTGTVPRPERSYQPPRRVQDGQALGATDIVLNVSALKPARTARPEAAVTQPVDAAAGAAAEHTATATRPVATRPEAAGPAPAVDLTESVLRQLDAAGPKVFGSAKGWRTARAKLLDRLPASEIQRRLKPMMAGQPWTVRVNGRQVVISASVKEMRHADNTKATEFNSAAVGVVGGGRTQEHLGGPQVVATGTNLTVVGTSDPIGATPVEVFGGGTLAHTTQVEDIAEKATATRNAVGTKSKVPGSVFDGVARLHFEFREPWRPFGRTVDKRVASGTGGLQRRIGELRDALAEQMRTDPQGKAALDLRKDLDQALTDQTQRIRDAVQGKRTTADGAAVFATMTRRAFGVRKRIFGDAEIGFQTLVETADAVKVADAGSARFDAPRPGTVRPRPARDAEPAAVSIPKPPESIWKQGMSGGQLVRDLPDMRSVRGLLDTEGRKAYAGAWDHVTSNGKRRADLVMDAFPKDRLMAGLPQMTRGEELTSEPFLINGRKAWVSAKAEVVGLTHLRDEAKAEVALATENSAQFSRRGLHSRQVYLVAQLGALAGASDAKLGAAATLGGGARRRTRGDQASGGRVFTNAKIPTPLEHFDGHVKVTFTFHHGGGTNGQAAGVVPFGLSVPVAEITEHVTEAAGHLFLPPQPAKAALDKAAAPKVTTLDAARDTSADTTADRTVHTTADTTVPETPEVPETREAPATPKVPEPPKAAETPEVPEPPKPASTSTTSGDTTGTAPKHTGPADKTATVHADTVLTHTVPADTVLTDKTAGAHTDTLVPAHAGTTAPPRTNPHTNHPAAPAAGRVRPPRPLLREVQLPPTIVEEPEPAEEAALTAETAPVQHPALPVQHEPVRHPAPAAPATPTEVPARPSAFDGVRQQHPEPIARNPRWTMWGHNGPTPETSSYAVEFAALDLRGVYAPPAPGQGIGAWQWHVGEEAQPVAVTPLTLRSPGRPGPAAQGAGTPQPFAASETAGESLGAALDAAPWSGGLHWREDAEDLYVFGPPGAEAREAVFADGLRPSGAELVHPAAHARPGGHPGSAWVTASRDIGWLRGQASAEEGGTDNAVLGRYGWRYDIAAPGGVDVNETLDLAAPHPERREVLYPGGVDSRYIRGAQRLEGGRPVGPYLTNPGFVEPRDPGTAETEGRQG